MKKYPLILIFSIYSSIAFILMGVFLSFVISEHIKEDKMANVQEVIANTVKSITRSYFDETNFEQMPVAELESIEEDIFDSLSKYNVQSITLVSKNGIVILPINNTLAGNPYEMNTNTVNVLRGIEPYVISDTSDLLGDGLKIDIYEPVFLEGEIAGVFILELTDQVIKSHVNSILQVVALSLSGGLLLLFLLLIGILYRTSKSLINQNDELVIRKTEIEKAYTKLDGSYKNTMLTLSNAVDVRDQYTAGHSERVTRIALQIARQLGLTDDIMKNIEYAAQFHDIGKLGIPDSILLKNDILTNNEYELIKKHPEIGVSILKNVDFLQDALPIILHHHERFSGNGYPGNLAMEAIPLGSRIIAIADSYDAMTSDRPYRIGLGHDAAVLEIIKNKGTQFDDKLVDTFLIIENKIRSIR